MAQAPGTHGVCSDRAVRCPVRTPRPVSLTRCLIFQAEPLCLASVWSEAKGAEPPAPGDLPRLVCPLSLEGHLELSWLQYGGLAGTWAQVSPSRQNLMVPDPNPAGRTADVGPGRPLAVFMVFKFIVPFNCPGVEWRCGKQFMAVGWAWSGARPFHLYFVNGVLAGPAAR